MLEAIVDLLPVWGLVLIVVFNGFGRCGAPLPSSVLMITAGALIVEDNADLGLAILLAFASAMVGDLVAYWLGHKAKGWIDRRAQNSPKIGKLIANATSLADRWGGLAIFISRWPLSTLGPYVNLVAGAIRMPLAPYVGWCALGEMIWVSLYLTLGYVFANNIDAVAANAGRISLFAGVVLAVLVLNRTRRARRAVHDPALPNEG